MAYQSIKQFYEGKNVFLTGGTGFLGMCYIEKLLRTMPNVGNIYVLLRSRKGQGVQERLAALKRNSVFEVLKNSGVSDERFNKIVPVCGDIAEEKLGLSDDDLNTLRDNVHIVVHSAATLDFETDLKTAVLVNLIGTKRVVDLCKEIKNLRCLLHISSAYTNSDKSHAVEKMYDAPADYDEIINYVQTADADQLDRETGKIMGDHINTYTFSKALAEHMVNDARNDIRTCIIRPSMIVATWKEPVEGWTISKNGPQGFIMGAMKGIVRRLPLNGSLIDDYIPVDVVVNTIVAGAWSRCRLPDSSYVEQTPIFHCTTSTCNPYYWNDFKPMLRDLLIKYPIQGAVWYPNIKFLSSLSMYQISSAIFHFIPGYILDFVIKIAGGRPILVRLHTNVNRSLRKLEPFIFREWKFDNTKTIILHNEMSVADQSVFYVDPSNIDWKTYINVLAKGVRKYLHNENEETLKKAMRKQSILRLANVGVELLVVFGIWYLSSVITGASLLSTCWVAAIVVLIGYIF